MTFVSISIIRVERVVKEIPLTYCRHITELYSYEFARIMGVLSKIWHVFNKGINLMITTYGMARREMESNA